MCICGAASSSRERSTMSSWPASSRSRDDPDRRPARRGDPAGPAYLRGSARARARLRRARGEEGGTSPPVGGSPTPGARGRLLCRADRDHRPHGRVSMRPEEIFGPVAVVVPFDAEEDAFARPTTRASASAGDLDPRPRPRAPGGRALIARDGVGERSPPPRPRAPWGGVKDSGTGREGGWESFHDFTTPDIRSRTAAEATSTGTATTPNDSTERSERNGPGQAGEARSG